MPTTVFTVQRIDSAPTTRPGLTRHVITATELIHGLGFQVETVDDFAASLCQRAQQLERQVSVIWKDGRYGRQIVQVDILPEPLPSDREMQTAYARVSRVAGGR